MKCYLTAILLAVGSFASPVQTQQTASQADAPSIAKLIKSLDATSFAEREQAGKELLALEAAAMEPLRKAMAAGRSVEFTRRAKAILDALEIFEPGGEVVNGLKVRLIADRGTVKPGDAVNLTTIVCNMTDKPLNVMVGYTFCGNYFECGSAARRADSMPRKPAAEVEPKCQVGFCGTGAGPIYVTLPPKSATKYKTLVATAQLPDGKTVYTLGKNKYFTIDGTSSRDDIRMVLSVGPRDNEPRPVRPGLRGEGIRPANEDAPFWTGTVRSNDVRLTLTK